MAESTHSPAPWEISGGEIADATGGIIGMVYGVEDFPCLDAEDDDLDDAGKEMLANAQLIKAAPELLVALKKLHNWSHCIRTVEPEELEADLAVVKAAIAAAEGKSS